MFRIRGLPVAGAARSWCDVAMLRPDLHDLVAAGDALARRRSTAVRDIGLVLAQRPGGRGVAVAREALALLDRRAESPQESRLRVLLTVGGLPPPAVNHVVRDGDGRHLARVDLAWPAQRLAVEYDGERHRGRDQWLHDLRRREALQRAGWRMIVVVAADLRAPEQLIRRVRAALSSPRAA